MRPFAVTRDAASRSLHVRYTVTVSGHLPSPGGYTMWSSERSVARLISPIDRADDWIVYKLYHGYRVFTARCYASAVLAMGLCPCLSVCLSVSVSVTSRSSTKTAKRRITQTAPYDSLGTLVFWRQSSPRYSTRVTPYGGAKCRWGGSKSATFDK